MKNATSVLQNRLVLNDCSNIVWCKHSLPRYAIVLCLACWKRMNTQDKLLNWGLIQTNSCALCKRFAENHDHLFFQCDYASKVWSNVLESLKSRLFTTNWQSTIDWLNSTRSWKSKLQKDAVCFALSAIVYHIWKERNNRLFQQNSQGPEIIIRDISQSITYNVGT